MQPTLNLLPHYSAKSVRLAGKSYYVDEQGDRLPSVTTILKATKPEEEKQALLQWRSRLGAQAANQITRKASRRGISLHKQIHRYLLGKAIELPEAVEPYWESVQPVLQDIDEIRLVEGTVFHYGLRYSGRVDCVASYRGIPCVLDWKSADKPKQTPERLHDAPLQLAAYCGAINQFYRSEIFLDRVGVVVALPQMPAEVFWFEASQLDPYWQQWEEKVEMFWSF